MPRLLGDRIRELREGSDRFGSLREFARELDRSPSWVSKVERNLEIPGRETLARIAELLSAEPDELYRLAEVLNPETERMLIERYAEVSGLLRVIPHLDVDQIRRLERDGEEMKQKRADAGQTQE